MNNKDKNKYFLYVRKSTDTEDKQVQSLKDQILPDVSGKLNVFAGKLNSQIGGCKLTIFFP